MPWLLAGAAGGEVSVAGAPITLTVDWTKVVGGTYRGAAHVTVDVQGTRLEVVVPVTANVASDGLLASSNGVALSSLPSGGVLGRTLSVGTVTGRAGVPWTASSSAAWLSATPSGTTGGDLVLAADPAGLAVDQVHVATVTLASTDPSLEHGETVRVALWVGSADPVKVSASVPGAKLYQVSFLTGPVEPWMFVNTHGTDVVAYNVFTGAVARTYTNVAASLGEMAISTDGRTLFVVDTTNFRIVPVDVTTGAKGTPYPVTSDYQGYPMDIRYVRTDGHPLLLVANQGLIIDVDGHQTYPQRFHTMEPGDTGGVRLEVSIDGRHLFTWGAPSPASTSTARTRWPGRRSTAAASPSRPSAAPPSRSTAPTSPCRPTPPGSTWPSSTGRPSTG